MRPYAPAYLFLAAVVACAPLPRTEGSSGPDSLRRQLATTEAQDLRESIDTWLAILDARLAPGQRLLDSVGAILRRDSGTTRADSAFAAARVSYARLVDSIGGLMWDDAEFQNWLMLDSLQADSAEALLELRGLRLTWSEGSGYASEDTHALRRRFAHFLSLAMQNFLRLRGAEEEEGFSDDASLRISWDQLASRIISWGRFLGSYPVSVPEPEAEAWHDIYLRTLLTGTDNSRIFDWETGKLEAPVREAMGRVIREHPDSQVVALVRGYLELLATADYGDTPAARSFLEARGIRTMLGVQPPIR